MFIKNKEYCLLQLHFSLCVAAGVTLLSINAGKRSPIPAADSDVAWSSVFNTDLYTNCTNLNSGHFVSQQANEFISYILVTVADH
ncbi:hypothetical protein NQ318_014261 [Aromia moschata]|uniref:Secreted protein n=1 Tax=Aromia moschata TaxID=1265417 RepID=A0AAV8Z0X4_9CUCU|nr:hypothetical protein NQ318_014261 [Aromia moschata]